MIFFVEVDGEKVAYDTRHIKETIERYRDSDYLSKEELIETCLTLITALEADLNEG